MPSGLVAAGVLTPIVALIILSLLSARLVRSSALESAAQQAELLEHANNQYSLIVQRVEQAHYPVNKMVPPTPNTVPLSIPATFLHDVGEELHQDSKTGIQVRQYSDYPFPWRIDGGPHDDFEREALLRLRQSNGQETVHDFTEIDGEPVVRYAQARIMKQSCVDCHNTHPLSDPQGLESRRRARGSRDHPPAEKRRGASHSGAAANAITECHWIRSAVIGKRARSLGKASAHRRGLVIGGISRRTRIGRAASNPFGSRPVLGEQHQCVKIQGPREAVGETNAIRMGAIDPATEVVPLILRLAALVAVSLGGRQIFGRQRFKTHAGNQSAIKRNF